MSELRQRRGEQQAATAAAAESSCVSCGCSLAEDAVFCMKCGTKRVTPSTDGATTVAKVTSEEPKPGMATREELESTINNMVEKIRTSGPKPGLSNNAKQWKDQLKDDPYNLDVMHGLGLAYAKDELWEKCANVMMRGLKRVDEWKDPEKSYDYLYTLCHASLKTNKHKQALLVLKELKAPAPGIFTELEVLQCQVYCANGEPQRGIKAFQEAIKGQEFEDACAMWAACMRFLKKADAYDICKQAMEAIAQKEENPDQAQKKLVVVESLADLRDNTKEEVTEKEPWYKSAAAKYFGVFYVICVLYGLWYLEGKNLATLNTLKLGQ